MIVAIGTTKTSYGKPVVLVGLTYTEVDQLKQGIGFPKQGGELWPFDQMIVFANKTNEETRQLIQRYCGPITIHQDDPQPTKAWEMPHSKTLYAWTLAGVPVFFSDGKPTDLTYIDVEFWELSNDDFRKRYGFVPLPNQLYRIEVIATKE